MEERKKFSPEQERAISTRDRTLLVSAAAGSGKTTTLTERIIRSLLDKDNPESIQNMLIVTFTNASVHDLKEKISAALTRAALDNPTNKRLDLELHSLAHARIMTIDSFCAELVRQNAERLGINPLYRIAETAETLILERSVMNRLIDSVFSKSTDREISPEKFERLCDALTGVKNTSSLADVLISLYEKTKSMVRGVKVFYDFANDYLQNSGKSLENTLYGKYIINEAKEALLHFPRLLSYYCEPLFASGEPELIRLAEYLSDNVDRLTKIANTEGGYDALREAVFSFAFSTAPTVSNPKPDVALRAIDYREDIKKAIIKLKSELLPYTEEEWKSLYSDMGEAVTVLAEFLDLFSETYFEEKRRRGVLEFSDIERLAYDALWSDGKITEVAEEYRSLFTSVYIDEYQDVNELQNKIFEAVSPPDKKFMVGDIKQSIYGFRSARPEIFADMKKQFPPLSDNYTREASIFMSNNYRCDEGIVDFVNEVFDKLFGVVRESIGYVSEDKLIFKKKYDGFLPEYEKANICIIEPADNDGEAEEEEGEDVELPGALWAEAEFVASKIEELLRSGRRRDGSEIKPSDIAVLMKTSKSFSVYERALERRGIPTATSEDKDFFMNKEILLTLSLLNAIDNPRKDVYLAALMCSPLYGFTADDLYVMKSEGNKKTLYDALLAFREKHPDTAKLNGFLSKLSHYRALCEGMSVDVLLTRLYRETGLLSLASKQGGKENLYKLFSYARRFEGSTYKGLYNFIAYVNNVIERGATFDKSENAATEGCVSIGTIHSSKGLEFPVVFLGNATSRLANLDLKKKIAFSEDFGISMLLRAPGGLALVENPLHRTIFDYMNKKYYEEAIRLLYVALTRAKEKLFIVGELKSGTAEEYLEEMKAMGNSLSPYSLRRLKSYMDMICAATDKANITVFGASYSKASESEEAEKTAEEPSSEDCEPLTKVLCDRFSFVYPRLHLTSLPEKMSVSRLYPTVLDGNEEDSLFEQKEDKAEPIPKFITESPADESARRGIATHNFLQFFDIENLMKNGVDTELQRLIDKGFISEKTAALVRRNELSLFLKSELISAMKNAKRLYREFRFNTELPAELFTDEKEKKELYREHSVLVQGVIDCLIENEDGSFRLIDYKTDRLTKEELCDEELARKKLAGAHSLQLSYYALAVEKIFGKAPHKVEVYSLPLGKTVSVK